MKKKISILVFGMFLFTATANAQEVKQEKKKVAAESANTDPKPEVLEKKECGTKPKKGGCCAHKKTDEAKS